jgi:L-asparaginase
MQPDEHGVLSPPKRVDDFLKLVPQLDDLADIEFVAPINKDSTNMTIRDWQTMATEIYDRRHAGFDGFVVAHGTDTMHFSASAVAFALGPNLWFPVVFTGAQTSPNVHHGDARTNLLRACKVALEDIAEVCISFGDFVFRGCRAQKKDERKFDAFESPAWPAIAFIAEDIEVRIFATRRTRESSKGDIVFLPHFAPGILEVTLIPGLEPGLVNAVVESDLCSGLILQSFGAGNVPNVEEYSFLPLIARAKQLNKPVIVTSQFPAGATTSTKYETGNHGAIPTGNLTNAAAVAKFRWVLQAVLERIAAGELPLAKKIATVKTEINRPYVGEMGS